MFKNNDRTWLEIEEENIPEYRMSPKTGQCGEVNGIVFQLLVGINHQSQIKNVSGA